MVSHAVNLILLLAGGASRREPAIGADVDLAATSDPLPQAFVLTAVVISFAVTIVMLVLAVIGTGDDDTDVSLAGRETELPARSVAPLSTIYSPVVAMAAFRSSASIARPPASTSSASATAT